MSSHRRRSKSNKKPLIIVLIILLVAALCVGAYFIFAGKDSEKPETKSEEAKTINPLTGKEVDSLPARPFILSTDNDNGAARPQSGLSQADIVYEVPVEGGGSRYEMIFYGEVPGQIGPARSVRPYIIDIAREYEAVLVHNGQSPQAKDYFSQNIVDHLSAIDDWDIFYRTEDRVIPHNCYTTGEAVIEKMKTREFDTEKEVRTFLWLKEGESLEDAMSKDSLKDASEIVVNYADNAFNTYRYNEETKLYERYVTDEACTDKENGKQIACANILIQEIEYNTYDEQRLNLNMTEGNKATLFTQGKVMTGTWERTDLDSPTIFKDKDGNEFKMTPGQTWIQLIDNTVKFEYK